MPNRTRHSDEIVNIVKVENNSSSWKEKDFSWDFAFFFMGFCLFFLGDFWFEIWPEFIFWKLEANDFTAS